MLESQTLTNIIMEIFSQTCNLRLDLNFFFFFWFGYHLQPSFSLVPYVSIFGLASSFSKRLLPRTSLKSSN